MYEENFYQISLGESNSCKISCAIHKRAMNVLKALGKELNPLSDKTFKERSDEVNKQLVKFNKCTNLSDKRDRRLKNK